MSDKFVQPIAQSNYELVPLPGAYITDGRFVRYEGDKNISDTVKDFDGKIESATEAAEEASDKADALDVRVTALENKPSGDDYSPLKNKPKINGVELSGNKTAEDLSLYSKPSGGIPKSDIAESVQQEISGKIDAPQTAEVGQVLAVKAVDASGKPTEWEVVDQSGGGGNDSSIQWFAVDETHAITFNPSNGHVVCAGNIYTNSASTRMVINYCYFYIDFVRVYGYNPSSTSEKNTIIRLGTYNLVNNGWGILGFIKSDVEKYNIQQITKQDQ